MDIFHNGNHKPEDFFHPSSADDYEIQKRGERRKDEFSIFNTKLKAISSLTYTGYKRFLLISWMNIDIVVVLQQKNKHHCSAAGQMRVKTDSLHPLEEHPFCSVFMRAVLFFTSPLFLHPKQPFRPSFHSADAARQQLFFTTPNKFISCSKRRRKRCLFSRYQSYWLLIYFQNLTMSKPI